MTASELSRKLLYKGYDDMVDYVRHSPFNRCIYNVLLTYAPKPLDTPMLTLFNEAYYQCVRVNYDTNPGADLATRYLDEETERLSSRQSAIVVFSIAWALLRCKENRSFNEECFVDQFYPLMSIGHEELLTYIIIKFTAGDRYYPPKQFQPLPSPVDELLETANTSASDDAWKELTNNYSQKPIERYLQLYGSPNEQLNLLSIIEQAYLRAVGKTSKVDFDYLRRAIADGKYPKTATDEDEYEEGMQPSYKEELEKLKEDYQRMKQRLEYKIAEQAREHKYELAELREKLEKKTLFHRKKKEPDVLLFTLTEMAAFVEARFSKGAAEEFTNMLYKLATEQGCLDEGVCKMIDDIVPSVLKRETINQNLEFIDSHQVNINPQTAYYRDLETHKE